MRMSLLTCLLWISCACHGSNLISSDADLERTTVGHRFIYLDDDPAPSVESVLSNPSQFDWHKSHQNIPNFGFKDHAYWFWLELHNEGVSDAIWYLEIGYPLLDFIEVYIQHDDGTLSKWETGDQHFFNDRPIHHRHFVFPIPLEMLEEVNIFIRVKTAGTIQVPAELWSEFHFYKHQQGYSIPHGTFIGLFIVIILYNLFLGITVRDISYFHYVTFATAFLGFFLGISGYGYQYIWSEAKTFQQYSVLIFIALALIGLTKFTLSFLKIQNTFSKTKLFLNSIVVSCIIILLLIPFIPYKYMIQALLISCVYSSVICIWTGIQSIHRLGKTAGIYTSAWAFLALGMGLLSLNKLGVIGNTELIDSIMPTSAGLMSLMLSFALGYRIQQEQAQRQQAERNALKSQKEALKARLKANELAFESEQIRLTAEAESRAKNEFLAMMSHEIRTPLNGIMGMSDLLKSTKLDNQQLRYTNTIYSSGESLLTIIDDILDFSKILAGKLDIENVPVNLFELLDNCTAIFSKQIHNKGIYLSSSLYPPREIYIQSDPVRLRQVMLNYMSNAIKFTEKGTVTQNILLDEKEEILRIETIDTGIGITEEQQEALFNAFSQADSSITRNYGGTGLGLAICKRLAELMHGRTGVSSVVGQGSTFWFECKVDIIDNGEQSITPFKDLTMGIACKQTDTQEFLLAHFENWQSTTRIVENLEEGETLDFLFVDHQSIQLHSKEKLAKAFTHNPNTIIDIGNFDSQASLRLPLTSAALFKAMQLDINVKGVQSEAIAHSHDDDLPLNGINILVAEDNSVNQMVIQALLKKLGAESTIAENGAIAYELFKAHPSNFDIILMDCEMPVLDGFSTTQKIRADGDLPPIPIIALTAHAMEIHKNKAKEAGMDDFLSKPIKRPALIQTILDALTKGHLG